MLLYLNRAHVKEATRAADLVDRAKDPEGNAMRRKQTQSEVTGIHCLEQGLDFFNVVLCLPQLLYDLWR